MRRFPLTLLTLSLACAACSKEPAQAPPAPVEVPSTPVAAAAPVAPSPTSEAVQASPAAAPRPRAERVVTYVPAKERRIHALINNAISRDVTGETEHDAAMWEAMRAACRTQACVDRAYAAQETALRKWEGSEAIR